MNDRQLLQTDRQARVWLAATMVLGGLTAFVIVAQALLLARIIAQVFLSGAGLAEELPALLGLAALALLRAALSWSADLAGQRLATRVKLALRDRLLAHLLALGPAYTSGERSGELANTALGGVEALDEYLSQFLPQVALSALIPLIILCWAFPIDLISGLVLLLTAPLIPLFMWLLGTLAQEQTTRQWAALSRLSAHFLDALQGLTTLKLFGRSRDELTAVALMSQRFGSVTMEVLKVAFLSSLALELIASLSTAILAVQIGLRLMEGAMAFEPALALLILAPEFYLPLRMLGQRHHAGMAGKEALVRIAAILQQEPIAPPALPDAPKNPLPTPIVFQNVAYTYPNRERPALTGFGLQIAQGQTVALVGESGAGKSTVVQLLLGFRQPDAGQISIGGEPLGQQSIAWWRSQVAWVSQHPTLFYGSVAENLRLARPDATQQQLEEAAEAAGAHHFIARLPQGYATAIGEGGTRLSGGQRQRLAIARAFLKNAPVIILDEVSSQLDQEHEAQLRQSLRKLLYGRTALVIAHRLTMVADADLVVVLREGQIVEADSPARLLERRGAFFALQEAYRGI